MNPRTIKRQDRIWSRIPEVRHEKYDTIEKIAAKFTQRFTDEGHRQRNLSAIHRCLDEIGVWAYTEWREPSLDGPIVRIYWDATATFDDVYGVLCHEVGHYADAYKAKVLLNIEEQADLYEWVATKAHNMASAMWNKKR